MAQETSQLDPGVAKTRAQLLGARKRLEADRDTLAYAYRHTAPDAGKPFADPSGAITRMRADLQQLRTDVVGESGGGAEGRKARDLTARALAYADQSLARLGQAAEAADPHSAVTLLGKSSRLRVKAESSSLEAAKALGIPWPL